MFFSDSPCGLSNQYGGFLQGPAPQHGGCFCWGRVGGIFWNFGPELSNFGPWDQSHRVRPAISCRFPVSIRPDRSPGPESAPGSFPEIWVTIPSFFGFFTGSFSWGSLTENDGRGGLYSNGSVMGSNRRTKPRSYRERPKKPQSPIPMNSEPRCGAAPYRGRFP